MRNFSSGCLLLSYLFFSSFLHAQDFSNKGKDFWVGYGYHVRMNNANGGTQQMVLYFATESTTNVKVSIPGLNYSVTYPNIPANTIFTSNPLPKTGAQDARLLTEGISNKGIHITSDKPVVAYAHIYDGNISGATLLFPTTTLGKEYFSVNSRQISNENRSNGWFYAVAVDTGTTVVEILPSSNTTNRPAGVPFTVSLKQGEIINMMGELTSTADPFLGVDLTGSTIKSISSGSGGCKRIAVFSGSGKISLTCNNRSASADNYIVQAFPKTAWGKRYLTAPTQKLPYNYFRVCVTDPSTKVNFNGSPLTGLQNNFFYEFSTSSPGLIEADKPILVTQYITSQGVCNNAATNGDPEVIYLSPLEQNIDKVILNSTQNFAITEHFINVVIKSAAVPSFRLDGNTVSGFSTHPSDPLYSYAQLLVNAGKHTIQADSGFNAIAYGYGQFESYGYNAGTNVKDLYQFVSVKNELATVSFPATCKNSPFNFSMTFPYQPTQIHWKFGAGLNSLGITDTIINSPKFDSTWKVNDKQLYLYRLPRAYTISTTGTYPIQLSVQNPTVDGCSGEQEINYDLEVIEPPKANFNFLNTGCITDSVKFTETANSAGRTSIHWQWSFGDGKTSTVRHPSYLYNTAGTYTVKYSLVNDIGCLSDTASKNITIAEPPIAKFGLSTPTCVGKPLRFFDSSQTATAAIVKWTWDFGDNTAKVVSTSATTQLHTYSSAGTFVVTLQVENAAGCKSVLFSKQIVVSVNPVANFILGNACLPSGALQFTNNSTISDGTQNGLQYAWQFGDGSRETVKNPAHLYTSIGPFTTSLVVTSAAGCTDSMAKSVTTIYGQPEAKFSAPEEICLGAAINVVDGSSAPASSVTKWEWTFGDGSSAVTNQNPKYTYAKAGSYIISLKVTSAIGCVSSVYSKPIIINALPTPDFTVSSTTCEQSGISFSNTSTPNAGNLTKWTWNYGDGSAPSNQASPSHIFTKAGSYNVSLQVENSKGCVSGIITKTLAVHPLPKVGFIVPGNCINDPITTFTDTTSIADGSESSFQWLWNFGDVSVPSAQNTSTLKNGQHKYAATGNYSVGLTVTSKNGCTDNLSQVFTLNGAVPVLNFSFQNGLQNCSNDSFKVIDNSGVNPGNLVKMEIFWDYTGDPTNKLVKDNPTKGAVYSHQYPVFFSPATKNVQVKIVAYSGVNCLSQKDTTLVLFAAPDIQFTALTPVCANEPAFALQSAVNNIPGTGVFTGKGVTPNGLFNPVLAGEGSHVIRYTFSGSNGCTSFKEQSIFVYPVPTVSAGPDKFILEGGTTVLNGTGSGSGLTYLWTPPTGLNNPIVAQPTAMPTDDINYILSVQSTDGCTASDQVFVKVLKAPTVPNAFSPNGDGIHDRWEIKYLDSYPGATVEIFNRYGQKIFQSRGYTKPWDGTLNGQGLPVGTYYYIIDPGNGRKPISGFVDIIR